MAREVFKRSVIFLVFVLIFSGCAEQAKESSPPATGLPVRVGLQNENGLPVEVRVKNESAGGGPVSLNMPGDRKFSVEIDTKEKQVIPVKVEGWDSLEKFMKAFVADINTLSIKLNIPEGSQLPPLQVSLPSIPSKVLMTITISVLAIVVAVFGALLAAFFAWRTSLNMKKIEKKIRSINLNK